LLRDAYQQAEQGTPVEVLDDAHAGDLAFFTNDAGRVTHVGILLRPDSIVHAAGQVRIDPIDKEGIIHAESGRRTHRLHSIRRFT
ncbi:MAG: NlpC/P60 family protein, partial [Flaviaesturariibacter sp.]|nr:NlpC/P60 family protein [Flaviaesturariibacter sp.]